jgi:hypothetical protein
MTSVTLGSVPSWYRRSSSEISWLERALAGLIQSPNPEEVISRPATHRPDGGFRELAKQTIVFV